MKKINLKKLSKMEWHIEHADARPFFVSSHVRGFVMGLYPASYSVVLNYYHDGEIDWITLTNDQKRLYRKVMNKQEKDGRHWQKIFFKWLAGEKEFRKFYYQLIDKDIKIISDQELLFDIKKYFYFIIHSRRLSSIIDPFTFIAETEFMKILVKFKKRSAVNINEAYNILSAPEYPSFFNLRDIELADLSKSLLKKRKSISRGNILIDNKIRRKIESHIRRYAWILYPSFTSGGKAYNVSQVIGEIKRIAKAGPDNIIRKNKQYLINQRKRRKYFKSHDLVKDIITLSDMIILFTRWQDARKENTLMASHLNNKYLSEIARRKKINPDIVANLDYSELGDFFKGNLNLSEIKRRNKESLFIFQKDSLNIFTDKKILKLVKDKITRQLEVKSEIRGTPASLGNVTGRAVIVRSIKNLKKVKKGSVLVATMTRPEHILAIRKAAAIVTDDGGITSHAAIISRELGIPCIIGTKIATQVLKDGDLVEVDANKGIVKILKK